jgi:pimeloyl-ACP methyl ester carboxylesterase
MQQSDNCLYTPLGARLKLARVADPADPIPLHWIFLPGGPGLGSESLLDLIDILKLPGTLWRLDLPGDGSNTSGNDQFSFSRWRPSLIEAVSHFERVVLVAHSTGGMYALAAPEIEDCIEGLVLLDSAPSAQWRVSFAAQLDNAPTPEFQRLQEQYERNPNNQNLKALTIASAPYLFTERGFGKGMKMLRSLSYSCATQQWSEQHFDQTYQAQWVPTKIPALIASGDKDKITPIELFINSKEFQRPNVTIKLIRNAGHFPWLDNPEAVAKVFLEFSQEVIRTGWEGL